MLVLSDLNDNPIFFADECHAINKYTIKTNKLSILKFKSMDLIQPFYDKIVPPGGSRGLYQNIYIKAVLLGSFSMRSLKR